MQAYDSAPSIDGGAVYGQGGEHYFPPPAPVFQQTFEEFLQHEAARARALAQQANQPQQANAGNQWPLGGSKNGPGYIPNFPRYPDDPNRQ